MTRSLAAIVLLCAATSAAQAPPPPPPPPVVMLQSGLPGRDTGPEPTGSGRIRGRIVDAESGNALRDALVMLSGGGLRQGRSVGTDEDGRFEFENLPAGRFSLNTNKPGYMALSYGQRRPFEAGRPIDLANAQTLDGIDFAVPRGGVIAVRVTDENGDPMSGIRVVAQRYRYGGAQRTLMTVGSMGFSGTDDLGEVRIFGLPPGDYFVSAAPGPVPSSTATGGPTYVTTYYPGTASTDSAERVAVQIGKEVSASFALISSRLVRVSGVVRRADRSPAARTTVVMLPRGIAMSGPLRSAPVQPDGTFSVAGVAPGEYEIQSSFAGTPAERELGRTIVTVAGADLTGVAVTMARGGRIRGQVTFEGEVPATLRPSAVRPYAGGIAVNAPPDTQDDGTFLIEGVFDPVPPIRAQVPPGWYLKMVRHGGRDVTDAPISIQSGEELTGYEIVLTQKRGELSGSAVDAKGQPSGDYAMVLFPEDRTQWMPGSRFIATARPDQQGRFRLTGLPPGRYLATAVEYLETGSERDPDLLGRLRERATAVTLVEGEPATVTLTVQ